VSVRIVADRELCKGHGQCELFAPDIFEIDDSALVVLKRDTAGEQERGLVEEAVSHCPESALRIGES
jgi:ferredoxin